MPDEVHDVAVAEVDLHENVFDLCLLRVGRDLHVLNNHTNGNRIRPPIRPLDFDDLLDVDTLLGDEGI